MTNLLMVMPYRMYVRKAREEGFRLGALWDPALEKPDYLREVAGLADMFRLTDFTDPAGFERALREAARDFGADLVYHLGREDSMLATYRVAEDLGAAVNSTRSVELLNDKLAMRELLASAGLSPVRFATADRWQDVAPLLEGFEPPVVVKPTRLAGSRGVYLLRDPADLPAWGRLLESYHYDGPVLVEEYLRGQEYSVETLSADGRHHVVGITRKLLGPPPLFVEAGHVHPVGDSPAAREMAETTVELLRLTGYRTGPAHTEVVWTDAGARIVESQARLGGDRIPRLIELSTGLDVERAIFQVLAGRPLDAPRPSRVAAITYFDLPVGVLRSVRGLDRVRELDFVDELSFPFAEGDAVPRTVDSKSRHGFAIVVGDCEEQALSHARQVRSMLDVTVEPRTARDAVAAGAVRTR